MMGTTINKINICGLGPGNPSLVLPMVHELVEASDIVMGGKRNLKSFSLEGKAAITIKNNLEYLIHILKNRGNQKITVVVSGDTGFHSMLGSISKHIPMQELNVVPGISSFQYMFARLGLSYENACLMSLHGKDEELISKVREYPRVFCLTDDIQSWKHIAHELCSNGLGHCTMHVANNLSYDDETLVSGKAEDLVKQAYQFKLCTVIIENGQ